MLSTQDFIRLFNLENNLIKNQADGLTHAESLIQPRPSGNCMNWVLGHILESQITLLTVLGGETPFDPAQLAIYKRESSPIIGDAPGVLHIGVLLKGLDAVNAALVARLAEMSDADFERQVPHGERMVRLGWRLLFLEFHYTYHVGQLEQLRQFAGHTDKIV